MARIFATILSDPKHYMNPTVLILEILTCGSAEPSDQAASCISFTVFDRKHSTLASLHSLSLQQSSFRNKLAFSMSASVAFLYGIPFGPEKFIIFEKNGQLSGVTKWTIADWPPAEHPEMVTLSEFKVFVYPNV